MKQQITRHLVMIIKVIIIIVRTQTWGECSCRAGVLLAPNPRLLHIFLFLVTKAVRTPLPAGEEDGSIPLSQLLVERAFKVHWSLQGWGPGHPDSLPPASFPSLSPVSPRRLKLAAAFDQK